jgi:hypothetical protein
VIRGFPNHLLLRLRVGLNDSSQPSEIPWSPLKLVQMLVPVMIAHALRQ